MEELAKLVEELARECRHLLAGGVVLGEYNPRLDRIYVGLQAYGSVKATSQLRDKVYDLLSATEPDKALNALLDLLVMLRQIRGALARVTDDRDERAKPSHPSHLRVSRFYDSTAENRMMRHTYFDDEDIFRGEWL